MLIAMIASLIMAEAPAAPASDDVLRAQAGIQQLLSDLNSARRDRDRAALERLYAPEYRWVHAVGYADDRARHIAKILDTTGTGDLKPFDFAPPSEFILQGDVAILRYPAQQTASGMTLYTTNVFVRRDGRWQFLHLQGTPLLPERTWIDLPGEALEAVAGRYRNVATQTETVLAREGNALRARIPGLPTRILRPVQPDLFYDDIGTEYRFERGPDGRVRAFSFRHAGGRQGRSARVPD